VIEICEKCIQKREKGREGGRRSEKKTTARYKRRRLKATYIAPRTCLPRLRMRSQQLQQQIQQQPQQQQQQQSTATTTACVSRISYTV